MSKKCLVICPFGQEGSATRKRSDYVFKNVIKPVADAEGYKAYRSIDYTIPGEITAQVVKDLYQADLVVADLTESNPNVFYELALRHTVAKPFILISDDVSNIPFDIATLNVIQVDRVLDLEKGIAVQNEIRNQMQRINSEEASFENDASRLHPCHDIDKSKEDISVKVYTWELKYTNTLATDWLNLQNEGLKGCVNKFLKDSQVPAEPDYRNGVAEYLTYKMAQGNRLLGDLYYVINKYNNTFLGWGNFTLPGSPDPLAIRIDGEDKTENHTDMVIVNFSQPSRKITFAMGIQEEIRAFNYTISFEKDSKNPKRYSGKLYHPDYDNILVCTTKMILI